MFKIDCDNNIKVTRGDKGFINFRCANYKLKEHDQVHFTVEELGINIPVVDFTAQGVACIDIEKSHTELEKGTYDYVIRVITELGVDETVIIGKYSII